MEAGAIIGGHFQQWGNRWPKNSRPEVSQSGLWSFKLTSRNFL